MPKSRARSPLSITTCISMETQPLLSQSPGPPTPIHTRGLGWNSSLAKADSPCEPKSTRVEELGANMGHGGQDGHGGTRGAAQPPSTERPSKTRDSHSSTEHSRILWSRPLVYAHCSPRVLGWAATTTTTFFYARSTCSVTLGGHSLVPRRRGSSSSRGRRRALAA